MEEGKQVKTDFTWNEIKILIGIKNCENLKEITINDIAKQIRINRNHPNFYKVLSYIINEEIMVLIRVIGTTKFFRINYKKIKDLIDEQERINQLVTTYIKKDHHFDW
jgi:hypothetical protein